MYSSLQILWSVFWNTDANHVVEVVKYYLLHTLSAHYLSYTHMMKYQLIFHTLYLMLNHAYELNNVLTTVHRNGLDTVHVVFS